MSYKLRDCPTIGGAGGGSQGGDDQLGRPSWRIESGLSRAGRAVGLGRSQGLAVSPFGIGSGIEGQQLHFVCLGHVWHGIECCGSWRPQ